MNPDPLSELPPPVRRHRHQFIQPAPLPAEATDFPPLSLGKVLVMARRAERCEQLFHPDDAPLGEDVAADAVLVSEAEQVQRGRQRRKRTPGEEATRRRLSADPAFRKAECLRKKAAREKLAALRAAGQAVPTKKKRRQGLGLLPPAG